MSGTPDHAGLLKKLGGGVMKQQQDRYFELHGRYLYYYKKKPMTAGEKPQGDIDMKDTVIADDPKNPLSWSISGPALPKTYQLTAASAGEKAAWVGALKGWKDTGVAKMAVTGEDESAAAAADGTIIGKKVCLDDFEAIAVVGKGSFGKVKKVRKRDTGEIFALKAMQKEVIMRENLTEHTKAEKNLLSRINHPFIVKLHYAFQDATKLYLVLDFLSGGEVFYHLSQVGNFTEHRSKFYTAQIATALGHIHDLKIIYRDLKPENCVLDKDGNCCITDFGLAKPNVQGQSAQTFCGTPEYLAPEFLTGGGHGKAVDWWSLGILLYEMMYGLPPFYNENVNEMYELILKKPLSFDEEPATGQVSQAAQDMCRVLLDRDPDKRLQTAEAFMKHPCYDGWDFGKMLRREMEPPFRPDPDKLNFDDEFTGQEARNSVAEAQGEGGQDFANFTFDGRGENALQK
eukprot:TRINITY_DN83_c0_g1_i3.p1 TRINITY_DN83_c0_g1~~TRINITY_DN83_c0_g1_i3.p1  ORF type:complete len:482 (+),score=180.10 TRINITY_DN83_c0_g1_i3:75-1448(+)